jgi:hypothetical protein
VNGPTAPNAWIRAAEALTSDRREGYLRGRMIVESLEERAHRNANLFDYWIEAADLLIFHADFALALLRGVLQQDAPALLERMATLRERTRELWARGYTRDSIQEELTERYGFHEVCLRGTGAESLNKM